MSTRDAILLAADRLFARDGFGLTGVDAIAAEAGVTKRTLYKHFGSKEALFTAWLTWRDEATRDRLIKAVVSRTDKPGEQLLALFDILGTLADSPNFHGCPFSRALLEFGDATAHAASIAVAQKHKEALSAWFADRLQAAGINAVNDATQEVALLYEGTLLRLATTRTSAPAKAAKRALERLLRDGRKT